METDGSLEETSWAGAREVGGTEHVEDEDERKASWACRGEGWRDGREVEVAAGWWWGGGEAESGGVWKGSGRWRGEQQSEAQERSLCSGCCLSAGGSGVRLHVLRVLTILRPVWTPLPVPASTLLFFSSRLKLGSLLLLTTILWFSSVRPPRLVFTSKTTRVGLVPRCGPPSALLSPLLADCPDLMIRTNAQRGGAMVRTNTHTNTITQRVQRWFRAI